MITTNTIAARATLGAGTTHARSYLRAIGALANDDRLSDGLVIEISGVLMQVVEANLVTVFKDTEACLQAAEAEHDAVNETLREAGM